MLSSPSLETLNPSHVRPQRHIRKEWIPVLIGLGVVCITSTAFMGGSHTQILVDDVWQAILGKWHYADVAQVNVLLRKAGHFTGYGTIGLFFRKGWYATMRSYALAISGWLMVLLASLSVLSTFVVACLDEWHQRYLPGRVGSFHDVLLDTGGALLFNIFFWTLRARRRRACLLSVGLSGKTATT